MQYPIAGFTYGRPDTGVSAGGSVFASATRIDAHHCPDAGVGDWRRDCQFRFAGCDSVAAASLSGSRADCFNLFDLPGQEGADGLGSWVDLVSRIPGSAAEANPV